MKSIVGGMPAPNRRCIAASVWIPSNSGIFQSTRTTSNVRPAAYSSWIRSSAISPLAAVVDRHAEQRQALSLGGESLGQVVDDQHTPAGQRQRRGPL